MYVTDSLCYTEETNTGNFILQKREREKWKGGSDKASLSITNSWSPPKPTSIDVMPSISSSVVPFSCPQSFPASGSFQMSQLFASGSHSIGVSASASALPMNIQDWFPLMSTRTYLINPILNKFFQRDRKVIYSDVKTTQHEKGGGNSDNSHKYRTKILNQIY